MGSSDMAQVSYDIVFLINISVFSLQHIFLLDRDE